jgi:hypothetical protein
MKKRKPFVGTGYHVTFGPFTSSKNKEGNREHLYREQGTSSRNKEGIRYTTPLHPSRKGIHMAPLHHQRTRKEKD